MSRPLHVVMAVALSLAAGVVRADESEALRIFLEREAGAAGRVEVSVGTLNARLQLAPCAKMQPFIPAGTRLWGRTTLGVRCIEGARWQAFLPVHIKVFGQAMVAARAMATGEDIGQDDVRHEEIELTRFAPGALATPAALSGKQLVRPVAAGEPLLAAWFRGRPVVTQGDTVKIVFAGPGFSVSAEGRALAGAVEGQSVRATTETGRVVTGTARQGRIVQVSQ